jgi:hypothetical protein
MSMLDITRVMRARLGAAAKRVPTRQLPNWMVRLMARFDPKLKPLIALLGKIRNATSAKAFLAGRRARGKTPSWRLPRAAAVRNREGVVIIIEVGRFALRSAKTRVGEADRMRTTTT